MARMKGFFNIVTVFFLILAIGCLYSSVNDNRQWEAVKASGVRVNATIIKVVELDSGGDVPDHDVYFRYTYDGKEYTYIYTNYPDGRRVGKTVTGYVFPNAPDELILSDGSTDMFFFFFLLGLALLFGIGNAMAAPKVKKSRKSTP